MSHPCSPDPRPLHYPDYTRTLQSDTARDIHRELVAKHHKDERDLLRIKQLESLLHSRGFKFRKPKTEPMTIKPKKERAHKHTPASHLEKPKLTKGLSPDELQEAKRQAARFLPR